MANAKLCDRCGRYFNPLEMEHVMCRFQNPVFQTKKDVAEGTVLSRLLDDEPADAWVDLCASCAEDFELFMDNMPLTIYNDPPMCEKDAEDGDHKWVNGYKFTTIPDVSSIDYE